jgi:hypothetical protein
MTQGGKCGLSGLPTHKLPTPPSNPPTHLTFTIILKRHHLTVTITISLPCDEGSKILPRVREFLVLAP